MKSFFSTSKKGNWEWDFIWWEFLKYRGRQSRYYWVTVYSTKCSVQGNSVSVISLMVGAPQKIRKSRMWFWAKGIRFVDLSTKNRFICGFCRFGRSDGAALYKETTPSLKKKMWYLSDNSKKTNVKHQESEEKKKTRFLFREVFGSWNTSKQLSVKYSGLCKSMVHSNLVAGFIHQFSCSQESPIDRQSSVK